MKNMPIACPEQAIGFRQDPRNHWQSSHKGSIMWECPKCHTSVESTFEICWSCGTTTDGLEDPDFVTADEAVAIVDQHGMSVSKPAPESDWERDEPPFELKECYRPRDAAEAKFLVDRLAELGIPAVVNGTHMGNTEYLIPIFAPRIEVRAQDFERARSVFNEFETRRKSRNENSAEDC